MTREIGAKRLHLIEHAALLSAETIPDSITGTRLDLATLRTCLAPMLQGQPPLNAWLCGPTGSGKTMLARRAVSDVTSRAHSSPCPLLRGEKVDGCENLKYSTAYPLPGDDNGRTL